MHLFNCLLILLCIGNSIHTLALEESHSNAISIVQQNITCNPNEDCYISCNSSRQCEYTTIICSSPDHICDIKCTDYYSCGYTIIISYSYNFSLSCAGNDTSYACRSISVRAEFGVNNTNNNTNITHPQSMVNIQCGNQYSSSYNCYYGTFDILGIDEVYIDCDGSYDCYYGKFTISDYDITNLYCYGSSSCRSSTFHIEDYGIANLYCYGYYSCNIASFTFSGSMNTYSYCVGESSCYSAIFDISSVDVAYFHLNGYYSCYNGKFNIIASDMLYFYCNGSYSCRSTNIQLIEATSNDYIDISCTTENSCYNTYINTNNNDAQLNLFCSDYYSCRNIYLSCYTHRNGSCDVICYSQSSCRIIYIDVEINNYTANFVHFNSIMPDQNQVYMRCYRPHPYGIIHTTYVSSSNGQMQCDDHICCPFAEPVLKTIVCEENTHCDVNCVNRQNTTDSFTRCDIINASKALSLDLYCESCVIGEIMCPTHVNSSCDISCRNSYYGGCLGVIINGNYSENINLECKQPYICQYSTVYGADNSTISVECYSSNWSKYPCLSMNIYASTVEYIAVNCVYLYSCSGLTLYVPNTTESSHIECGDTFRDACDGLTINLYADYEYQFTTFDCQYAGTEYGCGSVNLVCHSDRGISSSKMEIYNDSTYSTCSNWGCCPFTHKHIFCDHSNQTNIKNETNCVINCGGTNYNKEDQILCSYQYLYDGNTINCAGTDACNGTNVFCPNDRCKINCEDTNVCINAIISTNWTKELNISCMDHSCQLMQVLMNDNELILNHSVSINCKGSYSCLQMIVMASFSNELEMNCIGDNSCNSIYVNVSNGGNLSLVSQPYNTYMYGMSEGIIIATKAKELSLKCMGTFYQYACYSMELYIAQKTFLQCYGTACRYLSLYSNTSTISNNELNVLINYCQLDCNYNCIGNWNMYCGNNYSLNSSFDGDTCSNNNCCNETMFNIGNDYDECVVKEWEPIVNHFLFYYGLVISMLCFASFIFLIISFIKFRLVIKEYLLYDLVPQPPLFILTFMHLTDFIFHFTMIYALLCFIISHIHINSYCSQKYPLVADPSILQNICNADEHCDINTYSGSGQCAPGAPFMAISVSYYVFFGVLYFAQIAFCVLSTRKTKIKCNNFYLNTDVESFTIRIWQIKDMFSNKENKWKSELIRDYFQIKHFTPKKHITVLPKYVSFFILFTLILCGYNLTAYYIQLYAFYPVIISFIIVQILKIYYRNLSPYDENVVIRYLLIEAFGEHIGTLIFSYLSNKDTIWSPKMKTNYNTFNFSQKRPLLKKHKYSINYDNEI